MSALLILVLFVGLLICSIALCACAVRKGMKPARAVAMQVCSFAVLLVIGFASTAMIASADEGTKVNNEEIVSTATKSGKSDKEWDSIAMALAVGLASIGTGIAVAAAAPAAIGATSEDPKAFGKAIVFVGLAEGVTIFALLVVIFIKFI